jgi:hypothetical protein
MVAYNFPKLESHISCLMQFPIVVLRGLVSGLIFTVVSSHLKLGMISEYVHI